MVSRKKMTCIAIIILVCAGVVSSYAAPGWLHVDGNKVKDASGNVVMLRGISLIDLGSQNVNYGEYTVTKVIDLITNKSDTTSNSPGWYPNLLRLVVCPKVYNSPLTFEPGSDTFYNTLLRPVVDYCGTKGLYCIIDLHYVDPIAVDPTYVSQFWTYMAPKFANDSHVFFELFNEPNNDTSSDTDDWATVKTYMQQWVNIVRTYAANNLILVGTPAWCGILTPVVSNPISGTNICYVVHTYWVHWPYQYFRDEMINLSAVYPLFQTEWGFSTSNGDTSTITEFGQPLSDFRETYGIHNTAWCASTDWGPPMFYPGWTLRTGEGEMGGFVKDTLYALQGGGATNPPSATDVPATAAPTAESTAVPATPDPTTPPTETAAPTVTPPPTTLPTATPAGVTAGPTDQYDYGTAIPTADPTAVPTVDPTTVPGETSAPGTCTCTNLCTSQTSITVPFTRDGSGEFCYVSTSLGSYVNSWNCDAVNVNGTSCTNTYVSSSSIAAIGGYYYIYFKASYSWSHLEIK